MSGATTRTVGQLFTALQRTLGSQAAALELKWMRETLEDSSQVPSGATLEDMLTRRVRGEPLQYILETEHWTLRLSELLSPSRERPLSMLDLCTGSGCIPLLLCSLWPAGSVHAYGVDISEDAITLAKDNAALCDISVPEDSPVPPAEQKKWDRNTFTPLLANIRDPAFVISARLHPPFDVITSNPPYIPKREYDSLPASVKEYEDPRALLDDPESTSHDGRGLSFYWSIAELLGSANMKLLSDDGIVALEVGEGQASDVASIMEQKTGMRNIDIWKDPWDKERVVVARPT